LKVKKFANLLDIRNCYKKRHERTPFSKEEKVNILVENEARDIRNSKEAIHQARQKPILWKISV